MPACQLVCRAKRTEIAYPDERGASQSRRCRETFHHPEGQNDGRGKGGQADNGPNVNPASTSHETEPRPVVPDESRSTVIRLVRVLQDHPFAGGREPACRRVHFMSEILTLASTFAEQRSFRYLFCNGLLTSRVPPRMENARVARRLPRRDAAYICQGEKRPCATRSFAAVIVATSLAVSSAAIAGPLWEFTGPENSFSNGSWDFATPFTVTATFRRPGLLLC